MYTEEGTTLPLVAAISRSAELGKPPAADVQKKDGVVEA